MDVLILQQDKVVSTILTGILARAGYRPYLLDDLFSCYEMLQKKDGAAIVLLDARDTSVDILSLCELVRNTDIGFNPFILALYESPKDGDEENLLRKGVDDVVSLPINSGLLLTKIKVAQRWMDLQFELQQVQAKIQTNVMFNDEIGMFNFKAAKVLIGKELSRLRLLVSNAPSIDIFPEFFAIHLTNLSQIASDFGGECLDDVIQQLSVRLHRHLRGSDILFQLENNVIGVFVTSYSSRNYLAQELYEACINEPYVIGNIHLTLSCRIAVVSLDCPPLQLFTEIVVKIKEMLQQVNTAESLPIIRATLKNSKPQV